MLLYDPSIYYCEHNSPPLDPIHSAPSRPTSSRLILISSSHLDLFSGSGPFQLGFSTKVVFFFFLSFDAEYRHKARSALWPRIVVLAPLTDRTAEYASPEAPCTKVQTDARTVRAGNEQV